MNPVQVVVSRDVRRRTMRLAFALSVLGTLLGHGPAVRAQWTGTPIITCPGQVEDGAEWPWYGWGIVASPGRGYGQSFRAPYSGTMSGVEIDTFTIPNNERAFDWTLQVVEADGTFGSTLASGSFTVGLSAPFYNNSWTIMYGSPVPVEGGQTLFFGIQEQADSGSGSGGTGLATFGWHRGSSTSTAPYPDGMAYRREPDAEWLPLVTWDGLNVDFRLQTGVIPCDSSSTDPTISVDAIADDLGVNHVTLSGSAYDPDRIKEIWLDGGTAPVASWEPATATMNPTFSVEIPATGGPDDEVISGYVVDYCGNSTPFSTTATYTLCVPEWPACAADQLGYVFYVDVVPASDGAVIRCQTDADGGNLQCQLHYGM